jgi:hypothetical protein
MGLIFLIKYPFRAWRILLAVAVREALISHGLVAAAWPLNSASAHYDVAVLILFNFSRERGARQWDSEAVLLFAISGYPGLICGFILSGVLIVIYHHLNLSGVRGVIHVLADRDRVQEDGVREGVSVVLNFYHILSVVALRRLEELVELQLVEVPGSA